MTSGAHALTETHFCKQRGCENEARSSVGRYSYCDDHRDRAARGLPSASTNGNSNGHARKQTTISRLNSLTTAARKVDQARAKAAKLAEKALAAKREADDLQQQFEQQLRNAMGGSQ